MVLRLNIGDFLLPGTNRLAEAGIWQAASAAGIAPALLHIDESGGFLVSAFVETNLPDHPQSDESVLEQAFELLGRCHRLELDVPALDYARHIDHYWRIISNSGTTPAKALLRQREPMQDLLESMVNRGAPTALCHHDPVVANFVGSPARLYLIDWEYAARGMVVMDYAALAVEWGIDDTVVVARSGIEPGLLTMAKALYGYLCVLWEAVSVR